MLEQRVEATNKTILKILRREKLKQIEKNTLREQKLRVFFERKKESILVNEFPFLINRNSLKKIQAKGKLSFDL